MPRKRTELPAFSTRAPRLKTPNDKFTHMAQARIPKGTPIPEDNRAFRTFGARQAQGDMPDEFDHLPPHVSLRRAHLIRGDRSGVLR